MMNTPTERTTTTTTTITTTGGTAGSAAVAAASGKLDEAVAVATATALNGKAQTVATSPTATFNPTAGSSGRGMGEDTHDDKRFWLWKIVTNWTLRSPSLLRACEQRILSFISSDYACFYVDIGSIFGDSDRMWTISMNTESKEVPLVLLHGLGGGIALWSLNFDALARERPVYAMDIVGFGRSSRPEFAKEALSCEKQFVQAIENWRKQMNIKRMILLGHSLGGFLAASYALSYPQYLMHLILADPWGFSEKPSDLRHHPQIPFWARASSYAIPPLNPLWPLRAAGPLGKWIIQRARADVMNKFADLVKDEVNLLAQYIHQCNVQSPTGEAAYHTMMVSFAWAKYPMINRMNELHPSVPITFIFGSKSWVDASVGDQIKFQRVQSFVDVKIIPDAGHHVYAMQYDMFNSIVNDACSLHSMHTHASNASVRYGSMINYFENEEPNIGATTAHNEMVGADFAYEEIEDSADDSQEDIIAVYKNQHH